MGRINSIVIGGDIVPTESNLDFFINGDIEKIIGKDLYNYLSDNCFLICNLETPLSDSLSPIKKIGPTFATPTNAINGLKSLGVNLISLANNHIKDQGEKGIVNTCSSLEDNGIAFLGVGSSYFEASKPYFFHYNEMTIGVFSCVEHEFSTANDAYSYGANTFDPLFSLDEIKRMKDNCDYAIVLYHGGKEYYRYPSPGLQRTCRRIVDKGADLVVCQHSHCIGCKEEYKSGCIIYGQGNFIFNKKNDEFWNSSLLVCLDSALKVNFIPIIRTETGTRRANATESAEIMKGFEIRSYEIQNPGFIENSYKRFAEQYFYKYIMIISGRKPRVITVLNKLTKGMVGKIVMKLYYPQKQKLFLKNYIECESHRELIITAITNAIEQNK